VRRCPKRPSFYPPAPPVGRNERRFTLPSSSKPRNEPRFRVPSVSKCPNERRFARPRCRMAEMTVVLPCRVSPSTQTTVVWVCRVAPRPETSVVLAARDGGGAKKASKTAKKCWKTVNLAKNGLVGSSGRGDATPSELRKCLGR